MSDLEKIFFDLIILKPAGEESAFASADKIFFEEYFKEHPKLEKSISVDCCKFSLLRSYNENRLILVFSFIEGVSDIYFTLNFGKDCVPDVYDPIFPKCPDFFNLITEIKENNPNLAPKFDFSYEDFAGKTNKLVEKAPVPTSVFQKISLLDSDKEGNLSAPVQAFADALGVPKELQPTFSSNLLEVLKTAELLRFFAFPVISKLWEDYNVSQDNARFIPNTKFLESTDDELTSLEKISSMGFVAALKLFYSLFFDCKDLSNAFVEQETSRLGIRALIPTHTSPKVLSSSYFAPEYYKDVYNIKFSDAWRKK